MMSGTDHIEKATGHWVPSVVLRIGTAGAETAALLLDPSGRVRGDADLVFHGQPVRPSDAVRLGPDGLVLDLNGIEPAVERIVVAGWTRHSAFNTIPALKAVAPDGADIITYTVAEEVGVSAVALGVFFREADGWKFEGLGQGYGPGLAELITSYGIEVADPDRPTILPGLPSGPVLVDVAHEGKGHFALYPLDERNKDGEYVFAVSLPDLRGSRAFHPPKDRPLRFRVPDELVHSGRRAVEDSGRARCSSLPCGDQTCGLPVGEQAGDGLGVVAHVLVAAEVTVRRCHRACAGPKHVAEGCEAGVSPVCVGR
ncbi:TerD family protein [Streptomyces sp. NPDC055632]